jgi:hypothetical protein
MSVFKTWAGSIFTSACPIVAEAQGMAITTKKT